MLDQTIINKKKACLSLHVMNMKQFSRLSFFLMSNLPHLIKSVFLRKLSLYVQSQYYGQITVILRFCIFCIKRQEITAKLSKWDMCRQIGSILWVLRAGFTEPLEPQDRGDGKGIGSYPFFFFLSRCLPCVLVALLNLLKSSKTVCLLPPHILITSFVYHVLLITLKWVVLPCNKNSNFHYSNLSIFFSLDIQ